MTKKVRVDEIARDIDRYAFSQDSDEGLSATVITIGAIVSLSNQVRRVANAIEEGNKLSRIVNREKLDSFDQWLLWVQNQHEVRNAQRKASYVAAEAELSKLESTLGPCPKRLGRRVLDELASNGGKLPEFIWGKKTKSEILYQAWKSGSMKAEEIK